jgi:deoxycytidylate deaminase
MKKKTIAKTIEIANALYPNNKQKSGMRTFHAAFLIKKNKIIQIGLNKRRTHPVIKKHPYHDGHVGIHAELDAILKSGKEDLSDCDLIVLRVDNNGKLNNSKPCVGCHSVIQQFGIENIYYSTSSGSIDNKI